MSDNRHIEKRHRLRDLASHQQPFVTPEELADYFCVSRRQILRQIKTGSLMAFRLGSRSLRVPIEEAIRFERRLAVLPSEEPGGPGDDVRSRVGERAATERRRRHSGVRSARLAQSSNRRPRR